MRNVMQLKVNNLAAVLGTGWGVQKLMGEILKVAKVEFSTLS
jgi:hypothetical protein